MLLIVRHPLRDGYSGPGSHSEDEAQGQQGAVFSDSGFDVADAAFAQAATANFAQGTTAGATAWEGAFSSQEDLGAAARPLGGAVATAGAPAKSDDVAAYMKRVRCMLHLVAACAIVCAVSLTGHS